jgi:two-component system, OmpR family, response regulator RpaA
MTVSEPDHAPGIGLLWGDWFVAGMKVICMNKAKQRNILIVEDDEMVAKTIEKCLRGGENRVRVTHSGVEGLQAARREIPDLIILDVVMPGMDGFRVCQEIRSDPVFEDVMILFLTAKGRDEDKITGLTAGADDYMTKPFNIDELLLRIHAILRRSKRQNAPKVENTGETWVKPTTATEEAKPDNSVITLGEYKLFTRSYQFLSPYTGKIRLSPIQYDLLYHLMTHPGEVFTPNRLLDEIWDYPSDAGSPDLVRVHIKKIRERIEKDPHNPTFIKTVSGFGYTIDLDEG